MDRIIRKLRSESGATLMLALLMFVMCAVAGSVILAAGTASAGRAANGASGSVSQADQDMYTMASAVKVVRDQIEGGLIFVMGTTAESGKDSYEDADFDIAGGGDGWKYLSASIDTSGASKKYNTGTAGDPKTESAVWREVEGASDTPSGELERFVTGDITTTDSETGDFINTYYLAIESSVPAGVKVHKVKCDFYMNPDSYNVKVVMELVDTPSPGVVEKVGGMSETIIFPAKIREYDDEIRRAGKKGFSGSTLSKDTRYRRKLISWGEGSPE